MTIGLNHYKVFREDKKDSIRYIAPPPPPTNELLGNINIFENKTGKVYAYSLKLRHRCGFVIEGFDTNQPYDEDVKTIEHITKKQRLELTLKNVDSFIIATSKSNTKEEHTIYSIGIQSNASKNGVLLLLVNKLYQNSYRNVWKIRSAIPAENSL